VVGLAQADECDAERGHIVEQHDQVLQIAPQPIQSMPTEQECF
jgi:hypothetical protein